MKRIEKTSARLALASLALACLVPGCGESRRAPSSEAEPKGAPKKTLVLLDWTPNTNHTGLYVALELGYYAEAGLDVEIGLPPEGGAADLVAAGKADFGVSYQEQVTFARTADSPVPIVAIAALIRHNTSGFASRRGAGISSPKDWRGKRYGGWGSPVEEAMLKAIMAKYGADYSEVESVSIGSADFFAATERDIDFAWIFYGWDGVAAELRGIEIDYLPLTDLAPELDYYTPVLVASEETVRADPGFARAFLEATKRGYEYAIAHPAEAAAILAKRADGLDPALARASQEWLAPRYVDDAPRWGQMERSVWETYARWLLDNGLLARPLDVDAAFTNELLP
jgi:ABC-type nitrate/sulfonate/bicarbonate transport system substrate-binding protein